MRVQCDVCEKSEAAVVCCADEAALCAACDAKVHAANKLAGKHQRIPLVSASATEPTRCDICQEKTGWFFCLEDRALLCRACDVSIHSANALASAHKRFLITGVRIALKPLSPEDFLEGSNDLTENEPVSAGASYSGTSSPVASSSAAGKLKEDEKGRSTISEYLTESVPGWHVDELLNIPELAGGYTLGDVASSKADIGSMGDFDWVADLSLFEEQRYVETLHEVPEMTAENFAGFYKPAMAKGKSKQAMALAPDELLLVPDLGSAQAKRRRVSRG